MALRKRAAKVCDEPTKWPVWVNDLPITVEQQLIGATVLARFMHNSSK